MKKISGATLYFKVIFPGIWFGALGFFATISLVKGASLLEAWPMLIMAVFGFFLFRNLVWDLADEVIDEGDSLLFRKGKREQRVKLKEIITISHTRMSSPDRVTVHTKSSGDIGNELIFSLPMRLNTFSKSPIVTELIERVDRARNT